MRQKVEHEEAETFQECEAFVPKGQADIQGPAPLQEAKTTVLRKDQMSGIKPGTGLTAGYFHLPECGWPCRLNEENANTIELNDGSSLELKTVDGVKTYVWSDINGAEQEIFLEGTVDFDSWADVHQKLQTGGLPAGDLSIVAAPK